MKKRINKVIIFTLLLLSAIIFSSFNPSCAKYFKEEENLKYNLTVKQLYRELNSSEYSVSINNSSSTVNSMVLNFKFIKTGYISESEKEKYTLTVDNCTVGTLENDGDYIKTKLTCDPTSLYDSTRDVYKLNVSIKDKISTDSKSFLYTKITYLINKSDFNPPSEDIKEIIIEDNVIKIPKDYIYNDGESTNSIVRNWLNNYMSTNYLDYSGMVSDYFDNTYTDLTGNQVLTTELKGLYYTSDNDYYIFRVDEAIVSYARTFNSTNSTKKGYVYLAGILDKETAFNDALKYYYSDTTTYNDIISYINNNGGINKLISGEVSQIAGLEYSSTNNSIKINLDSILSFVYPSSVYEFTIPYISQSSSQGSPQDIMYSYIYEKIQNSNYDNDFKNFIYLNDDLYYYTLSLTETYSHYYYYKSATVTLLFEIAYVRGEENVTIKIHEIDDTNNVYNINNAISSTSSYGSYTISSGSTMYLFTSTDHYETSINDIITTITLKLN